MHFSELVKGICHLSAARRQIGRKNSSILVSEKLNLVSEKSVKSRGILFLHEGGHPESLALLIGGHLTAVGSSLKVGSHVRQAKFCLWVVRWVFSGISRFRPTLQLTRLKMSKMILTGRKTQIKKKKKKKKLCLVVPYFETNPCYSTPPHATPCYPKLPHPTPPHANIYFCKELMHLSMWGRVWRAYPGD